MKRIIDLGEKQVALEFNAATPFVVKRMFDFDIFRFFKDSDGMDVFERIPNLEKLTYAMAMQAEFPLREAMEKGDGFLEWASGFDFDEMTGKLVEAAVDMWLHGNKPSSEPKNGQGPQ